VLLLLMSVMHHTASTLVQSSILERGLDQTVRVIFVTVAAVQLPVYLAGTPLRAATDRSVMEVPNQLCMIAGALVFNAVMWHCLFQVRTTAKALYPESIHCII
jgi:hypothetical protein